MLTPTTTWFGMRRVKEPQVLEVFGLLVENKVYLELGKSFPQTVFLSKILDS